MTLAGVGNFLIASTQSGLGLTLLLLMMWPANCRLVPIASFFFERYLHLPLGSRKVVFKDDYLSRAF